MPTKPPAVQSCLPSVKLGLAAFGILHALIAFSAGPASQPTVAMDKTRRAELVKLVRQDCGSCHGLTLQGGLGPALLPETLKDKPTDNLRFVILHGRPGTAMPPWQRFLNEAEAEWIVANLLKGFPSER